MKASDFDRAFDEDKNVTDALDMSGLKRPNHTPQRSDIDSLASSPPGRDELIKMVAKQMYSERILNNAHRGDLVEILVLSALGKDWKHVGLGWHPWDLQRGEDSHRDRIQVRHCAARQLWGPTKRMSLVFGWKKNPPAYFHAYNPGEAIESEGWFCDVFVFGIHEESDEQMTDQADPAQWRFIVVPRTDLSPGQQSITLQRAKQRWKLVQWGELSNAVEAAIARLAASTPNP